MTLRTLALAFAFALSAALLSSHFARAQATAPTTTPTGLPGPVATQGVKKPIASRVINLAALETRTSTVGTRRDLFDGPTATLNNMEGHISTLNPGEVSHQPHQHVNEEMVILVDGTLDVSINGKITKAEKGAVLFFSSNDWHNVKNVGTTPAMYYVLNWSVPAKVGAASSPATAPATAEAMH